MSTIDEKDHSKEFMIKRNDFRGYYLIDPYGTCVAKTCSKCRNVRPVDEFPADVRRKYGIYNKCRQCCREYSAQYNNRPHPSGTTTAAHRERVRRNERRSRTSAEILEDQSKIRPEGNKKCRKCRSYLPLGSFYPNISNLDGLTTTCRECHKEYVHQKRIQEVLKYWKDHGIPYECYITGSTTNLHIDHVVPLLLGGEDSPSNMLPLRYDLNCSKQGKPLTEWMMARGDISDPDTIIQKLTDYGVNPFPVQKSQSSSSVSSDLITA